MLKCNDCGCEFENPKVVYESRGEFWGAPAYEAVGYCPNCGSDYYEEYDGEGGEEDV